MKKDESLRKKQTILKEGRSGKGLSTAKLSGMLDSSPLIGKDATLNDRDTSYSPVKTALTRTEREDDDRVQDAKISPEKKFG